MAITRRSAILQVTGQATATFGPGQFLRHTVFAFASIQPAQGPPSQIKLSVFGQSLILKAKSLSTPSERALYTQLWFCHLEFGLVLSDPLVLDDSGMKLRFQPNGGAEKLITIKPICSSHLVVNEKQRMLVLLTTILLAAATGGNGFERERKNEIFEHITLTYREQTEASFLPAAKTWPEYWSTSRNSARRQELFVLLSEVGKGNPNSAKNSKAITAWLLSLTPTEGQIRKDKLFGSLPQSYLDFHRFMNGWWALPVQLSCALDEKSVTVRALDDWRQRSRLLTIGAAWKMLFGKLPLPAFRILVDREFAHLPQLALSSDGKSQSVILFSSLVPAGKDLMAVPVNKSALDDRAVVDLQHIYPSLDDPLEFLFYGLVASLALDGKEKAETQLNAQMAVQKLADLSGPANKETLVLSDAAAKPEVLQCLAEPDWRWFSRWTQISNKPGAD